ncbi:MAG: GIY-YIG nuclease family protein [Patescibacteria group bacterium]|nr:GIY-YIG nuclease family protein [Patescibacteria group bacterium]MDE2590717.1 GIY-YIG nuclease family protein [Patescibacteria group bacterium]
MCHHWIFIFTNLANTIIYVGATNNLMQRIFGHKQTLVEGLTKRYNLTKLVYQNEFQIIPMRLQKKRIKG